MTGPLRHIEFYAFALMFVCLRSVSLDAQQQPSALQLFAPDSVTHVILETDIRTLVKQKFKEEYQPAVVRIIRADGDTISFDLEVRSRGNMRKEVCYYPPIFVKFPKDTFSYHKLKWVNVCRDSDVNEEYLLKEYATYRMLGCLTEMSLETRLLRVDYIDTGGNNKSFSRYAFVIQSEEELVERYGGRIYEPTLLKPEYLNKGQLALISYFEYMIGNTDWELLNSHNILAFTHPESETLIPVAYDFDYSGFVGTTYAVPHESIPVKSVADRYNKSYCMDAAQCNETRILFLNSKERILQCCADIGIVSGKCETDARRYLSAFFDEIENPRRAERIFVKECKTLD